MLYEMECESCDYRVEFMCSLEEHTKLVKPGFSCDCGGHVRQVFTTLRQVHAREGFPKGDPRWEHVSNDPIYIRDKVHLKDVCEENGNVSRFLEDAM